MRAWIKDQGGNVAVMFALAVFMLLALGGGAFTMVRVNAAGTRLQDAADGAALAAAIQSQTPGATKAEIQDAADRWAASALGNHAGFDGPALTTVALEKTTPVKVTVSMVQAVDTLFAGVIGVERITVRRHATAVAGPRRNACLILLEPTAPGALDLSGTPNIRGRDCVAHVNSAAEGALRANGASAGADLQAIYVAGTPGRRSGGFSPTPLYQQPPLPDPLTNAISWPSPQPCPSTPPATAGKLKPGVYCDGLLLDRGAELGPGVYVVQQGGLTVQGRGVRGEGVVIVLLDPQAEIKIPGNNALQLSAPKSGPWSGIAIAAKPGAAVVTSRLFGVLELDGTLYLPGQSLQLQGNARIGGAGSRAIIARRFEARGNAEVELAGGYPSSAAGAVRLSD
jgi:Flp pilus assembly protein TadG